MTRFRIFLVFLTLLLPVSELAAQPRVRPLTKMDLYRLPEAEFQRRVLEQLTSSLYRSDNNPGLYQGVPKYPLEKWISNTRPRATWTPGLCQSDQLYFQFEPIYLVGEDGGDAQTPVTISSVTTQSYFHFIVEPDEPLELLDDEKERFELNKNCAKLELHNFFTGDDEGVVATGVNRLLEVLREAKTGAPLKFVCSLSDVEATNCRPQLATLEFKNIYDVSKCRALNDSDRCSYMTFKVPSGLPLGLRIHWNFSGAKEKIIRVDISELITHSTPWRW